MKCRWSESCGAQSLLSKGDFRLLVVSALGKSGTFEGRSESVDTFKPSV